MFVKGEFRKLEKNTSANGKDYFNVIVEERIGHPMRVGVKSPSKYKELKQGTNIEMQVGAMAKVSKNGQPYMAIWEI